MGLKTAVLVGGATVAVAAVCAPVLLPVAVQAVGFGAGGIMGGSTAASIMSLYGGNVAVGSACAVLQSIGATGAAPAAFTAAANVVAGVSGCTSVGLCADRVRRFFRRSRREAENTSGEDGATKENPGFRDAVTGDNPDCGDGVDGDNSGSTAEDDPDSAAGDMVVSGTGDKPASVGENNLAFGDGVAEEKPACSWPTDTCQNQLGLNPGSGDGVAGDDPASVNHAAGDGGAGDKCHWPIQTWEHQLGSEPESDVGEYPKSGADGVAGEELASLAGVNQASGEGAAAASWPFYREHASGDVAAADMPVDGVPFYAWQHQLGSDTDSDDGVVGDNMSPALALPERTPAAMTELSVASSWHFCIAASVGFGPRGNTDYSYSL